MIRRKLFAALGLLALSLLVLVGCDRGYDIFMKNCPDDWGRPHKQAAWPWFLRNYYGIEAEDGTLVVDPSKVTVDDVLVTVESILDDIEWVLDSKRSPRWRALLLEMPSLREAFEREEERWLYIKSQLNKVRIYNSFLEALGQIPKASEKPYDILYLWPENTQFDWSAPHIEKAKEEGRLKEVERGFFYVYTPFGYKVEDPSVTAEGTYIWKPKLEGFLVISYAILNDEEPDELYADYVEIFRARLVEDKVQTEKLPCLKAFRKLSGSRLEVAVVDYDHEGEPGYGEPDSVKSIYVDTGWEILQCYKELREELAKSRVTEREEQREIVLPPLELVIAPVGSIDEYKGEYNPDGWTVPYEYKDEHGVNYRTYIIEEELPDDYPFSRIAYIVKVWADGAVYEYWTPKPEYSGDMETLYATSRNLVLQPVGKAKVELATDQVIDKLYRIVYKYGDVWVELIDLDGVGRLQYKIEGVSEPEASGSTSVPYQRNLGGF